MTATTPSAPGRSAAGRMPVLHLSHGAPPLGARRSPISSYASRITASRTFSPSSAWPDGAFSRPSA